MYLQYFTQHRWLSAILCMFWFLSLTQLFCQKHASPVFCEFFPTSVLFFVLLQHFFFYKVAVYLTSPTSVALDALGGAKTLSSVPRPNNKSTRIRTKRKNSPSFWFFKLKGESLSGETSHHDLMLGQKCCKVFLEVSLYLWTCWVDFFFFNATHTHIAFTSISRYRSLGEQGAGSEST